RPRGRRLPYPFRTTPFPRTGDLAEARACHRSGCQTPGKERSTAERTETDSMSAREHARNTAPAAPLSLVAHVSSDALARAAALVGSSRGLADVFHELLAEQSLDALLERIADTVRELVPYHELVVYEADDARRELIPVLVRSQWAQEIVDDDTPFGVGITGWAVEHREPAH